MGAIVGVVPNFSEGRRRDVIDAIVGALGVEGARVVFAEADPDHHRLDTTVLGTAEAVHRSAIAGAAVAIDRIDMFEHRGGHPRMGAVDVVPFMPVRGVEMAACVDLARAVGRELAETFAVPVYLYGEAARRAGTPIARRRPEGGVRGTPGGGRHGGAAPRLRAARDRAGGRHRRRSPQAARGVQHLPVRDGRAGGEGHRSGIRESAGGLPAVRAIGFAVPDRGCVTVSMNLVDFEVTGVRTAFDAVVAEASARGMEVLDSEIVGLAPAAALPPGTGEHVRLAGFSPDEQILEELVAAG